MSMMVLTGGPFDGLKQKPEEGFPAPNVLMVSTRETGLVLHKYNRTGVEEHVDGAQHIYVYDGVEPSVMFKGTKL